jgi:hypothetical protein
MDKLPKYIILIPIFFNCCFYSNQIYFDIKDQTIKTCNPKGIICLYIENSKYPEVYRLEFNDTQKSAPKLLNINSVSELYSIFSMHENKYIDNNLFKLAPMSDYIVERVQGDASGYKIEICTDQNRKVIRSSHEDCQN